MKRTIKIIAALLALVVLFSLNVPVSSGDSKTPAKIRVGLYFNDTSVKTALPSYNISAASGLDIGFVQNGNFVDICRIPGSVNIIVKKDDGYYIKIGSDASDASSANAFAASLKQQGIIAQVVFSDSWQVWSGAYSSEAEARAGIDNVVQKTGLIPCSVIAPASNRIAVTDSKSKPLCVFQSASSYLTIQPSESNNPRIFKIEGKPYRGILEIRRSEPGCLTAINIVTIQEYLYGNVPAEIGGRSPVEALKAQAVASKMYAINNLGKHAKSGFDLCATTGCQVYKGYSVEVESCNKAIDEVYDKIITYNGEPARHIYYFASSGGITEDVKNVWGSSYPYLVSVEDKYEKITTWTKTLRASDIKALFPQLGNILGITITKTAPSGRVTELAVRGDSRSDPAVYTLEKTRTVFGLNSQLYTISTDADIYVASTAEGESTPKLTQLGGMSVISSAGISKIKSSKNSVTVVGEDGTQKTYALVPETYTFTGKGWGHAVGMSQEGAIGMANAGMKYDEILTYYFQGTKVE